MNRLTKGIGALVLLLSAAGCRPVVQDRAYLQEQYEESILESIYHAKRSDKKRMEEDKGIARLYGRVLGYSERQLDSDLSQIRDHLPKD